MGTQPQTPTERGTAAPTLLGPRSPISAAAEHLLHKPADNQDGWPTDTKQSNSTTFIAEATEATATVQERDSRFCRRQSREYDCCRH